MSLYVCLCVCASVLPHLASVRLLRVRAEQVLGWLLLSQAEFYVPLRLRLRASEFLFAMAKENDRKFTFAWLSKSASNVFSTNFPTSSFSLSFCFIYSVSIVELAGSQALINISDLKSLKKAASGIESEAKNKGEHKSRLKEEQEYLSFIFKLSTEDELMG